MAMKTEQTADSPYQTVSSRTAYQTKFVTMIEDDIIHPNGQPGVYSYLRFNGAVTIVPVDQDGNVYLVKVWRYPTKKFTWEVPMGRLDNPDDQPLETAKRELMEEAGLTANQWTELARLHPHPSTSNELATIFLAQDLTQQDYTDVNEVSDVKKCNWQEIDELIQSGQMSNGEAVTALLLAKRKLAI